MDPSASSSKVPPAEIFALSASRLKVPPPEVLELSALPEPSQHEIPTETESSDLPRTDGGKDALLFLAGCFMVEAATWGLPFSYGVFQEYYSNTPPFSLRPQGVAAVATCALAMELFGAPVVYAAINRYNWIQVYLIPCGIALMSLSMLLASFATAVWQLILTQGILFGCGGAMLLYTTIHFLDGWFVKRKGLAFGILCTGNGVAGAVFPFILNWTLQKYGYRTTLRSWAIILPVMTVPFLPFLKPRVPLSRSVQPRRIDYRFVLNSTFWLYQAANIFEGLGYYMPSIYLSAHAQKLGYSKSLGSLLIALINIAAVFGQLGCGYLSDRMSTSTVMLMSATSSGVAILALWGTATTIPVLVAFAFLYGLTAGGWASMYLGMTKETVAHAAGADAPTVFGWLCAGRGIGAIICGPLSEILIGKHVASSSPGYRTEYGTLIIFTGVSALCGGLTFVGKRLQVVKASLVRRVSV